MTLLISLFGCGNNDKKPFGAENINYDEVEKINKEGPLIDNFHAENSPPISDQKTFVESGPPKIDYSEIIVEPTSDMDEEPDFGGIPVVNKERNVNGS